TRHLEPGKDLVAYFCAEFGFYESLQIYSGGLGILAGDQCKAASDLRVPFVAVGLLYHQGFFKQTIDGQGNQTAHYKPSKFADLPVIQTCDADGKELRIRIELPDRTLSLKIWQVKAGHVNLYLLDSELPENSESDRSITYQLYGGDSGTRIQQEIVLGIGGVRALRAVGIEPTAWHINEGHAAFQVLERCREQVQRGMDFASALEMVAAGTVFTTHTPIPAGHDIFSHELVSAHLSGLVQELDIGLDRLFALGDNPSNSQEGFNMTALALRGSRFHNGVSREHGCIASEMEACLWSEVSPEENPISHVTNGVHVPTFLRGAWANLFDMRFGGEWRNRFLETDYWRRIDEIPNHQFWSIRQTLK
ncbi:MAG: alpha-glucan family phosphorylase, partial [Gammaproteobacteria bacterium]|nr:alpha-glucan family phosphorylase [Gammaproteobacteria bacterium]